MSFHRWGFASIAAGALCFAVASSAEAGELEQCRKQQGAVPAQQGSALLGSYLRLADSPLDLAPLDLGPLDVDDDLGLDPVPEIDERNDVTLADLEPVADFHPETDRWTERNNRIRITFWQGAWFFSNELDVRHDYVMGFRINWEVPGFIGIRWDSGFVGWSRMEVKLARPNNPRSSRHMSGYVQNHTLSLGIFNPELSIEGLSFWAGFGAGVWIWNYEEDDIVPGVDGRFGGNKLDEISADGVIFVELDYKISDIFHVGFGIRQHFLLADHTDEGRFYDINGTNQSFDDGRNNENFDDMAGVTEITFNISVLF